jgi:hypothetical protein
MNAKNFAPEPHHPVGERTTHPIELRWAVLNCGFQVEGI